MKEREPAVISVLLLSLLCWMPRCREYSTNRPRRSIGAHSNSSSVYAEGVAHTGMRWLRCEECSLISWLNPSPFRAFISSLVLPAPRPAYSGAIVRTGTSAYTYVHARTTTNSRQKDTFTVFLCNNAARERTNRLFSHLFGCVLCPTDQPNARP